MNQPPSVETRVGLYEAMSTLRAVRKLRADPIPDEALRRVLEAASWAPSGGNVQPWRVLVVRDPEIKEQLGALYQQGWSVYSKGHLKRLDGAPERVIEKNRRILAAGDHLASNFGQTPVILVFCFNPEHMAITDSGLDRVSVVGGGSIYPAVQNALLACRAEGLGCVLTTLLCEFEPQVREILSIPEPWGTAAAVPIGYPVGRGHGPITRKPIEKLAFSDIWGEPLRDS